MVIIIVIDVGEPPEVFEMFDSKGIPYIRAEIRMFYCKDCGKIYVHAPELCECGSDDIEADRVGDFTNTARTWVIERKTESDFVGSMLDKSLHAQAAKMAKYYSGWKFVFLEGFISVMVDDPHHDGNIKPWIRSMRVTLRKYDVCMWQCDDLSQLVDEVFRVEQKCGEGVKIYDVINDKYKGWSDSKKFICKLIDVSDKKADILLEEFGNPVGVIEAILSSEPTFTKTGNPKGVIGPMGSVKGFGPKFIIKNKKMLYGS